MSKKMGRPTRKEVATNIVYEGPNGEILYFAIDHKGNSKLIGNKSFNLPQINFNSNICPLPQSRKNTSFENHEKSSSNEKKIIKNEEKSPKLYIEMSKFDSFIMRLDSQLNMESFLTNHKLSDKLLPSLD